MHHFFFIHSSFDGHPGCLYVLVGVNNASVTSCPFEVVFWVPLDKYSEVKLLGPSWSPATALFF